MLEGALQLAASCRYFPAGTIFLAVVDPGVGSARRGIAAEAGDYRFVAPDNGVLTAVFRELPPEAHRRADRAAVRAADREPHVRRARSVRAGGGVAGQGHSAVRARPHRDRPISSSTFRAPRSATTRLRGVVLLVDRFGNLVTNIDRRTFEAFARDASGDR